MSSPSPFIYWGQNTTTIFLRIALKDVQQNTHPDVSLSNDRISFEGRGIGGHGDCVYKFDIKPYRYISPEKSRLRVTGSEILVDIPKQDSTNKDSSWPRLTKDATKYAWIKPDFDRMDISEDEDFDEMEKKRLQEEYINKITGQIEATKDEAIADLKKNYLFSYSLFQFIAWTFILVKISIGLAYNTPDTYKVFDDVGTVLVIAQSFSFLEVIHPLIGLVKAGALAPLMQFCGRGLILLVLIWNEPKLQNTPVTTYLVLFWSLADVIRHPFYMMSAMKMDFYWLVWLRYTAWIPLYPLGVICEGMTVVNAIPLYTESGRFSLTLPNPLNFSFSLTSYLYFHLVIILPGLAKLMLHMYSQRKKRLGGGVAAASKTKKTN